MCICIGNNIRPDNASPRTSKIVLNYKGSLVTVFLDHNVRFINTFNCKIGFDRIVI